MWRILSMVACYLTAKSAFSFYVANNIFLSVINLSLLMESNVFIALIKNVFIAHLPKTKCLYSSSMDKTAHKVVLLFPFFKFQPS